MSATNPLQGEALLVVGPKRSQFRAEELSELRSAITERSDLGFLTRAVGELESLWPTIIAASPGLKKIPGDHSLRQVAQFLKGGDLAELTVEGVRRDNILLEVVTVLSHVVSFYTVATSKVQNTLFDPLPSAELDRRFHDIQGFCLGFLTAAAVATVKDKDDFASTITTILRIAVCIGAVVEADAVELESSGTQAVSLTTGWKHEADYDGLEKILGTYQDVSRLLSCGKATLVVC